jgi:transcriptional regulator with XRE-family HTH domain
MPIMDDPAISRRKLKGALRVARLEADLTREDAAAALDWSLSKLVRIETGDQGISVTDLRAMLQLYKVSDENLMRELTNLARSSRGQTWWSGYRDVVTKQYGQLLGYEGSASYIRPFHPLLIPGLLHTDDYAFELRRVRMPEERARRLVNLLAERQERLFEQPKPPETTFIFGEEALHRLIGDSTIMRHQLHHLLTMIERATVSIQIVPFSAGAHPGLIGPFTLLGLKDSGEDLLFFEGPGGDIVNRDDEEMIISFTDQFEKIRSQALSDTETTALINQAIAQIGHGRSSHHNSSKLAIGEVRPPPGE